LKNNETLDNSFYIINNVLGSGEKKDKPFTRSA
jgi:hypothetical protein